MAGLFSFFVQVLHVNKKKQIDFSKEYKQVPIMVVNGEQVLKIQYSL